MASVVDVFAQLKFDSAATAKALEKEGDKSAAKAGQNWGSKFSKGFQLAAGAAMAAGIAGAMELDTATRQVAASAGIAGDEMGQFRQQVVELYKLNPSKSFAEIAETVGALKSQFQLTTPEALAMTQQMLDFSKVTGQTAPQAVEALDNVLDVFNLDAAEAGPLMDKLVFSHQKWGGSVTENEAALSKLGPQLAALNLEVDDGLALLNLFAVSGIDSGRAMFALNTAVQQLKPGETLDTLINRIASIADPTLRAQAATESFGARGAAIFSSLVPNWNGSLEDFKVSNEQAAGAVAKGADIIDDSFRNKVQGAIRSVIAPLAELGVDSPTIIAAILGIQAVSGAITAMGVAGTGAWLKILGPVALLGIGLVALAEASKVAGAEAAASANDAYVAIAREADTIRDLQAQMSDGKITLEQYNAALAGMATRSYIAAESQAALRKDINDMARTWAASERAATEAAAGTVDAVQGAEGPVIEAAATIAGALPKAIRKAVPIVARASLDQIDAYLDGIASGVGGFVDRWDDFTRLQKNALTDQEKIARIGGVLQTTQLAQGINDARPEVRAAARAVVLDAVNALIALGGAAGLAGTSAGQQFAAGFGAGAGAVGTFNANAVTTSQVLATLNYALEAGGVEVKNYSGDIDKLRNDLLGVGADTDKATGKTRGGAAAHKDAAAAAENHAQTLRDKLGTAFDALRDIATRALDRIHEKNVRAIEDARALAHAVNDQRLNAAEGAQDAVEAARQERDLVEDLAAARSELATAAPEDQQSAQRRLRSAEEALQSFYARRDIAGIRTEVEAANAAADKVAEEALTREDARDARERTLLAAELATLEKHLNDMKITREAAHAEIQTLFAKHGLDYETAGKNLGQSFANGLKSKALAVEAAAVALATAANKVLKTGSPAQAGPWHRTPPEKMGEHFGQLFQKGIFGEVQGLQAGLESRLPTLFRGPSVAPATVPYGGAGESVGGQGREISVTNNFPAPERAEDATLHSLRLLAATGQL